MLSNSVTHMSFFPLGVVVLCVSSREAPLTHPWSWLGVNEGADIFHQAEWDVGAEPYWEKSLLPLEGSHALCCRYDCRAILWRTIVYGCRWKALKSFPLLRPYDDTIKVRMLPFCIHPCLPVSAEAFSAFVGYKPKRYCKILILKYCYGIKKI